eukprot:g6455.t1
MWAALCCPEEADPSFHLRQRRKRKLKPLEKVRSLQQLAVESQVIDQQNKLIQELGRVTRDKWDFRHAGAAGLRGKDASIRPYLWIEFDRSTKRLQRANSNLGVDFTGPDPGTYRVPQFPEQHPSSHIKNIKCCGMSKEKRMRDIASEIGSRSGKQLYTYKGSYQDFTPGPNNSPVKSALGPQYLSQNKNSRSSLLRGKPKPEKFSADYSKTNYRCEPSSLLGPQILSQFPSSSRQTFGMLRGERGFSSSKLMENVPYTYSKETTNPNVRYKVPATLYDPNEHGIGGHAFSIAKEQRSMNKVINPRYVDDAAVGTYNLSVSLGKQVESDRPTAARSLFSKAERPLNKESKNDSPGPIYNPDLRIIRKKSPSAVLRSRFLKNRKVPIGHKSLRVAKERRRRRRDKK